MCGRLVIGRTQVQIHLALATTQTFSCEQTITVSAVNPVNRPQVLLKVNPFVSRGNGTAAYRFAEICVSVYFVTAFL